MNFKNKILNQLISDLQNCPDVFAVWEGGSAANARSDQYSDIDLNILTSDDVETVFETIERALQTVSEITHVWRVPKSIWPDLSQKIYFLKDAPKHFFVDAVLFRKSKEQMLVEFMQTERHGTPIIYFDRTGLIVPRPTDQKELLNRQKKRFAEIIEAYPVFKTLVLKELDRGNLIDAFNYYQNGIFRPLVELLGMIHRPFHFDFGLRYLKHSLPSDVYDQLEELLIFDSVETLRKNAQSAEDLFNKTAATVRTKLA